MSAFCANTSMPTFSPFVDSSVSNVLLQTNPDFNRLFLKFVHYSTGYQSGNGFCSSWWFESTCVPIGMLQSIWLMTADGPATAGPVLDRHWSYWKSHRPEWCSATDPLPSTDHVSGTVYRRQFATQHCQLLSYLIDLRLISLFSSCSVCNSQRFGTDAYLNVLTN